MAARTGSVGVVAEDVDDVRDAEPDVLEVLDATLDDADGVSPGRWVRDSAGPAGSSALPQALRPSRAAVVRAMSALRVVLMPLVYPLPARITIRIGSREGTLTQSSPALHPAGPSRGR